MRIHWRLIDVAVLDLDRIQEFINVDGVVVAVAVETWSRFTKMVDDKAMTTKFLQSVPD